MELDVREVASILHVPEYTVYRLIDEDDLPASRSNGQYRFSRAELLEWASARSVNPVGIIKEQERDSTEEPRLVQALQTGGLLTGLRAADKDSLLRTIVEKLPLPDSADREGLLQLLLAREKVGSTAVGNGIAIPHSRFPVVLPVARPLLTLCYLDQPVAFGAGALGQVDTMFVLVTPTVSVHLQMIARLAALIQDETVKGLLKQRRSLDELLSEARRIELGSDRVADCKRAS